MMVLYRVSKSITTAKAPPTLFYTIFFQNLGDMNAYTRIKKILSLSPSSEDEAE
jgi:hypothetical protein